MFWIEGSRASAGLFPLLKIQKTVEVPQVPEQRNGQPGKDNSEYDLGGATGVLEAHELVHGEAAAENHGAANQHAMKPDQIKQRKPGFECAETRA
jgi:hypothetical protein